MAGHRGRTEAVPEIPADRRRRADGGGCRSAGCRSPHRYGLRASVRRVPLEGRLRPETAIPQKRPAESRLAGGTQDSAVLRLAASLTWTWQFILGDAWA